MAILNKITVGNKLVLEVNANPISAGANAPIGSQALWKDDTDPLLPVGRSYLKIGPADTDWTAYQVGQDVEGWYFGTDVASLNEATTTPYFGTKSGDFDLMFTRNGMPVFQVEQSGIRLSNPSGGRIRSNNALILQATSGMTISTSSDDIMLTSPNYFRANTNETEIISKYVTNILKENTSGSYGAVERKSCHYKNSTSTMDSINIDILSGTASLAKMAIAKIFIYDNSNTLIANFVKTMTIDNSGAVIGSQDDYTAKQSGHGSIRAELSYSSVFQQWRVNLINLPSASQINVVFEEIVSTLQ